MNRTIAGMIGALTIIAPVAVMAAPANPMAAASYAEMLKPAPTTTTGALEASNATLQGDDGTKVELVQYFGHRHHHHHHHGFHRGFGHRGFHRYHHHHRHFF